MEYAALLDDVLDPEKLDLPEPPKVLAIHHEPYIDSLGLEGARVWVIVPDDSPDEHFTWKQTYPIRDAILRASERAGLPGWASVDFLTESEFAEDQLDR